MNWAAARDAMVRDQLETRHICDPRVLQAMRSIPRHLFVPPDLQRHAYEDRALAIGYEQTISQPYMVASMLQWLGLKGHEKVLEIGTGGGYQAAVLGQLARQVFSLEIIPELARRSRELLQTLQVTNVQVVTGDGSGGYPAESPYDAIVVAAASPEASSRLKNQLTDGGRLVLPVNDGSECVLTVVTRNGTHFDEKRYGRCAFVPLRGLYGVASDS